MSTGDDYMQRRIEILREFRAVDREEAVHRARIIGDHAPDHYESIKDRRVPESDTLIYFGPRGQGSNWLPCMVCGPDAPDAKDLRSDMASFVSSREKGLLAVAWFADAGLYAHLDYRDFEPNWVQVKVGACPAHVPLIERLMELVGRECVLDPTIPRLLAVEAARLQRV